MKKLFGIIWLICFAGNAHGQGKWSYQACINYAIENNMELKNYMFDIESRRLSHRSSLGNFLPTINANTGYGINIGKTIDPNTNTVVNRDFFSNSYGVSASLMLFNGFRQINHLALERFNLTASKEILEREKSSLALKVLDAYALHLIQTGLYKIQLDHMELSKQEVYRIKKHIELGLASGSELYEMEARLSRDEFLLVQLQNLRKKSEFELKKLMNWPIDSMLEIEDTALDFSLAPMETTPGMLYNSAKSTLPKYKILALQFEAAKRNVRVAKSSLIPSLHLYGGINTGYYETYTDEMGKTISFSDQIGNNRRVGYGLSLSIPLFDGFQRRINVQQQAVELERAKNELNIGMQNLVYEIDEAVIDLDGAVAEYESSQKKEESMKLAYRIAESRREKGLINIMEFFEAKNNLAEASAEVLRTKLQVFLKERAIHFYLTGSFIE